MWGKEKEKKFAEKGPSFYTEQQELSTTNKLLGNVPLLSVKNNFRTKIDELN